MNRLAAEHPDDERYQTSEGQREMLAGPEPTIECPACGSTNPPVLLGTLGRKTWLRCRDCGIDFHEAG